MRLYGRKTATNQLSELEISSQVTFVIFLTSLISKGKCSLLHVQV